jgi:hypothetical protein
VVGIAIGLKRRSTGVKKLVIEDLKTIIIMKILLLIIIVIISLKVWYRCSICKREKKS